MAQKNPTPEPADLAQPSHDERMLLAMEALAKSNATIVANTPIHRLTFDEWLAKHPQPTMPFPVLLNGYRLEADMLDAEGLGLLHKLQEGRFFGRRIHVYQDRGANRTWNITWPSKSLSDRMTIMQYGSDLTAILRRITTETPDIT
jgi:hypothetical protein